MTIALKTLSRINAPNQSQMSGAIHQNKSSRFCCALGEAAEGTEDGFKGGPHMSHSGLVSWAYLANIILNNFPHIFLHLTANCDIK